MQSQDKELGIKIERRHQQLLRRRDGWRNVWTLLSKYILMRPANWMDIHTPWYVPRISVANVSDDEVVDAARTAATALGGALWPNTAESFEVVPRQLPSTNGYFDLDSLNKREDVRNWFDQVTKIMRMVIDAPESGFHTAWAEYLDEQVVFGTSGIHGIEDPYDPIQPIKFRALGVEVVLIDENEYGVVDTVYIENVYTVRQMIEKYGDNVSPQVMGLYKANRFDDFIKVIHAIEPRPGGRVGEDVQNKPVSSVHMELATKHVLQVGGFDEMPAFMTRFRKRATELYGRSLALDALPSVKEMNVLRRAFSKALDKILDPPIGFYHDMIGGSGEVDISAGAKVPLYATGRIPQGQPPIQPLLQIQEPAVADNRLNQLVERVAVKFLIDRLLDFNNKTRMTAQEANMRLDFRNQALGNIFSRQIIELLNPLVKWVFQVLWRRKMFGLNPLTDAKQIAMIEHLGGKPFVIPLEVAQMVAKGQQPFQVRFISPAARAMKADSMMGLTQLTNYLFSFANAGMYDALDNFDVDAAVHAYQELSGAPANVIRSSEAVAKLRKAKEQAAMQQQNAQLQEHQANLADKSAKAAKNFAQAGLPPTGPVTGGGLPNVA